MIETIDLLEKIEKDLNNLLPKGSNLEFKIWGNVGEHKPPERNGNTVKHFIVGSMKSTSSSMEANKLLAIGVNGFTIEFMVPIRIPITAIGQDVAELQTIQNGQFVFPAFVIGTLSQYFKTYKKWEIQKTENGVAHNYAVGIMGGIAQPGDVDIKAFSGNSLPVSVYVTANIVEGGTVSTDITVEFNGATLPAQVVTPSRTAVLNSDVLSGNLASKSVATSSAFALQVQMPTSTVGAGTKEVLDFLMFGNINKAYFTKINWGNHASKHTLMLIARCNGAAEGVTIAGLTVELTEVLRYTELLSVPTEYQVGKFILESSLVSTINAKLQGDESVLGYIAGEVKTIHSGDNFLLVRPEDIIDEGDHYAVYLITNKKCTISGDGFTVVKAGA